VGGGSKTIVGYIYDGPDNYLTVYANGIKVFGPFFGNTNYTLAPNAPFTFDFDPVRYNTTQLFFRKAVRPGAYGPTVSNLCVGCGTKPKCSASLINPQPPPPPPAAKAISFSFSWTNSAQWSCDSGNAVVDGAISLGKIGYGVIKTASLIPGAHSVVFTGTPYLGCTCLNTLGCLLGSTATYSVSSGFTPLAGATLTQRYTQSISFTVP
jgi:hypothetical protein